MNIHAIYGFFMARFRPARIAGLKRSFPVIDGEGSILDVGGSLGWWQMVSPRNRDITIVNLDGRHEASVHAAGLRFLTADARELPFADGSFDLVVSNSVIEHVGSLDDQRRFAREAVRCGRALYLQTPNRWFPIEPHLIAPFIHWLPFPVLRRLVRWCSVWGWVNRPSQAVIDEFVRDIRLLNRREAEMLFPGCDIGEERFLGMTKSFVITRRAAGMRSANAPS